MEIASAEKSQAYIETHYVTRSELSKQVGIPEQRILELVEAQCIPPHSYELRGSQTFISAFGEYSLPTETRFYYHPDLVHWIERANLTPPAP